VRRRHGDARGDDGDATCASIAAASIVAKVARLRCRIFEVGISYAGRTYEEGKKIGFRDALNAFYCIVRFWMFD